jgi:hypothetical protein
MPRLWLDYPNGRHHEIDYRGDLKFEVGDEFEMHGRRWRVERIEQPRDIRVGGTSGVIRCSPLTESALRGSAETRA